MTEPNTRRIVEVPLTWQSSPERSPVHVMSRTGTHELRGLLDDRRRVVALTDLIGLPLTAAQRQRYIALMRLVRVGVIPAAEGYAEMEPLYRQYMEEATPNIPRPRAPPSAVQQRRHEATIGAPAA